MVVFLATGCENSRQGDDHVRVQIELNSGQKWMVNAEMKPYILEAEQILVQFDGSDYKTLAEQLKTKNKGLIKSCTMQGRSHDELHKWLHPHMQLIEDLDNADSQEQANRIIGDIKASFETYHRYFQ